MGTEYIVFLRNGERFKQLSVPFDTKEEADDFANWYQKPGSIIVVVQVVSTTHN